MVCYSKAKTTQKFQMTEGDTYILGTIFTHCLIKRYVLQALKRMIQEFWLFCKQGTNKYVCQIKGCFFSMKTFFRNNAVISLLPASLLFLMLNSWLSIIFRLIANLVRILPTLILKKMFMFKYVHLQEIRALSSNLSDRSCEHRRMKTCKLNT